VGGGDETVVADYGCILQTHPANYI